jgi:hypothetical protein
LGDVNGRSFWFISPPRIDGILSPAARRGQCGRFTKIFRNLNRILTTSIPDKSILSAEKASIVVLKEIRIRGYYEWLTGVRGKCYLGAGKAGGPESVYEEGMISGR